MIYLVTKQQDVFPSGLYKVISVEESLKLLEPLEIVGLDTETSGLDVHTKELLLVQLGCKEFQVVIDTTTIDIQLYKDYLESSRLFILCNAKFDLKFFFKERIIITNIYDLFLGEKLRWLGYPAGMHSLSLQAMAAEYINVRLDKTIRGKIINSTTLSEDIIQYSARDVEFLEDIMNEQKKELEKEDLLEAIKCENHFVLPLAYCEYCGIKLDIPKWKEKCKKDKEEEEKALAACNEWLINAHQQGEGEIPPGMFGKYVKVDRQGDLFTGFNLEPRVTLNWNSATQLLPIFKLFGIDVSTKDKEHGGTRESVDAKVLKPQGDKCSLIPIYLKYKECSKVTSTYGENFLKQVNKETGRIHTQYRQMGGDTTRITSGGKDGEIEYVNLLNLPADAETRSCFIAESGNRWISIDYSGQETYLMASIANDKAIIEELTNGSGDIHSLTAYMSYKEIPRGTPIKDIKSKYHNLRQDAKGIEFAINYGGDYNTISQNKGIPLSEAKQIYDAYMEGFSGLKKYQEFRRKDWWDKGYILLNSRTKHKAHIYDYEELRRIDARTKEDGFWQYYKEMKSSAPGCDTVKDVKRLFKRKSASSRQSINYPIQATGSMCLRLALIYFFNYLKKHDLLFKVLICVTPYDEINCEAPEEIAEDIANILYKCMVKAGELFCTRCKLDADISRLPDGTLPTYWIH